MRYDVFVAGPPSSAWVKLEDTSSAVSRRKKLKLVTCCHWISLPWCVRVKLNDVILGTFPPVWVTWMESGDGRWKANNNNNNTNQIYLMSYGDNFRCAVVHNLAVLCGVVINLWSAVTSLTVIMCMCSGSYMSFVVSFTGLTVIASTCTSSYPSCLVTGCVLMEVFYDHVQSFIQWCRRAWVQSGTILEHWRTKSWLSC